MNLHKIEEENSLVNSIYEEQLDHSSRNERLPEFDVIGTALNEM